MRASLRMRRQVAGMIAVLYVALAFYGLSLHSEHYQGETMPSVSAQNTMEQ